jgi:hypothetical protein
MVPVVADGHAACIALDLRRFVDAQAGGRDFQNQVSPCYIGRVEEFSGNIAGAVASLTESELRGESEELQSHYW